MGLGVNEMPSLQGRHAYERGYRALMRQGLTLEDPDYLPDTDEIVDLVADLLVYGELSGYAGMDEIVDRAMVHARAEIDGDDLTTDEG